MIYAALYTYDQGRDDIHEVRPSHRDYLKGLFDGGQLLASGPRADGALLILSADTADDARELLAHDPMVTAGIVTQTDLEEWTVVYGPWS